MSTQVILGDSTDVLPTLPKESIDLIVTSPPYDNLRTYNHTDEWSFETFKNISQHIPTVLKDGGVCVWVVGDQTIKGSETGSSFRQVLHFMDLGLRLHDTMIYQKTGISYPSGKTSVRYSQEFEYMFVLSKGRPKTINLIKDKKNRWSGTTKWGTDSHRQQDGSLKEGTRGDMVINEYGYRTNIWKIKNSYGFGNRKESYKHPGTFPLSLSTDHILTWTNPGETVLDIFSGSGTTGVSCVKTDRNYIGIERNPDYYELSKKLIKQEQNDHSTTPVG